MKITNELMAERHDDSDHSFAFDIETEPNFTVINKLFERRPFEDTDYEPHPLKLGNAKKPGTIAKLQDEHRISEQTRQANWDKDRPLREQKHERAENERYDEYVGAAGLEAHVSKILCVSYADDTGPLGVDWAPGTPEPDILKSLWWNCREAQARGGQIFTFSGSQFDLRFCYRRSLILGIRPECRTFNFNRGRAYPDESFVDVKELWDLGEYSRGKKKDNAPRRRLNDLAIAFGLDGKTGDHGARFWRLCKEDIEKAEEYAKQDARIAWEIGSQMREAGMIQRRNLYRESTP